ncbi:MAG: S1C family serine protease, partial [Akkermansiaceae bacterium]|nr:S1C family serine protease [Akkermansiaceae bacterium]
DVLVEFDGQKIGDFDALRDAVRAKKPGDEVEVAFVQGGELLKKKVVLAEHQLMLDQNGAVRPDQENNPLWQGLGGLPKDDHDRMRELMKRRLEELGKQLEENGAIQFDMKELRDLDQNNRLNQLDDQVPAPRNNKRMFNFNSQSSMTVMDEEGSVTIKVTGTHHEVIVKDKEGEILFEGPYETAKDKAAVPDDVRGRIDNIDFFKNMKNGFRFKVDPQLGELDEDLVEEE